MDFAWYESFFTGITLDFWRKAVSPEQTRLEVDFLQNALGLTAGARVLDVPCGLGRHAIELASRGFQVTGVDLSSEAIEEARTRSAGMGLTVEWARMDMRDLPYRTVYDGAFCFGNSFGFLEPGKTRSFVQAVSRAIKPGACFALDSGMTAESILPRLRDREWMQVDEILFLEENRYHVAESCVETTYTFLRGGETHVRTGIHWVYTVREIRAMLAEAGLVVKEQLGSLTRDPFQVGSPYLLLVAEKHG